METSMTSLPIRVIRVPIYITTLSSRHNWNDTDREEEAVWPLIFLTHPETQLPAYVCLWFRQKGMQRKIETNRSEGVEWEIFFWQFLKKCQKLQLTAAEFVVMEPQEIREGYLVKKVRITTSTVLSISLLCICRAWVCLFFLSFLI